MTNSVNFKNVAFLFLLFFSLIYSFKIKAQDTTFIEIENRTYTQVFDSLSTGLIYNRIPFHVLYNRVYPWAGLDSWTNGDTTTSTHAFQAWWELENSHMDTITYQYDTFKKYINYEILENQLKLLVIHYDLAVIDTDAYNDGRLTVEEGIIYDEGGASPYLQKEINIVSLPIDSIFEDTDYKVWFDETKILNNTTDNIDAIIIQDIATGTNWTLDNQDTATISFNSIGERYLKFLLLFTGGDTAKIIQSINVQFKTTGNECNIPENHIVISDIPFKGYNETVATTSIGNYKIYYRYKLNSTTECEHKIEKPILIVDGFDPTDQRGVDKIYDDYLNNTANGFFGNDLRIDGYDLIILNFPVIGSKNAGFVKNVKSYSTTGTYLGLTDRIGRDGGADFIERNSFVLEELIEQVNDSLIENNSNEKLVMIGPSMGGLISRYALAYMEKKYAATSADSFYHNTRLWVSFDSPHEGANIPIGSQTLLYFMGYQTGQRSAYESFSTQLRSNAAQQMLIEQLNPNDPLIPQFDLNNTASFRQNFINNLTSNGLTGSNGFPENCRRISLVNGSGSGTNVYSPGVEYLDMKAQYLLKIISFKNQLEYNNIVKNHS